jgi:hypothetical protein
MSIHLIFWRADGFRTHVDGIWPTTTDALIWAQDNCGAVGGIAKARQ